MTEAWQTINGITWSTTSAGTRWETGTGWCLDYTVIDGIDGWYLTGPGVDQRWMSIQFVESARQASHLIAGAT
ncbi:hypothetical protein [Streptomyces olivaceus]|uniref:hypothetical protein n=1 Tax=Streptomyces olivaceus TaxID=47716 RepID=UPI0004C59805|nr:hypothetical protein [Streptomyces olivaceus]MBZ6102736.1 hypothetical protein [Streptomyces olivaceus]